MLIITLPADEVVINADSEDKTSIWSRFLVSFSKIFYVVSFILFVLLIFGVLTDTYRVVPILSGSMSPSLEKGSLAIVVKKDIVKLEKGEITVFQAPNKGKNLIAHRIHKINEENDKLLFRTKGDANTSPDSWEFYFEKRQTWVVAYNIPHLGKVFLFFDKPKARTAFLTFGAIFYLVSLGIFFRRRRIMRNSNIQKI